MANIKFKSKMAFFFQKLILVASYNFHRVVTLEKESRVWAIGVSEICGLVNQMGLLVDKAITVCFTEDPFSVNLKYTYKLKSGKLWKYRRVILGPYWLGQILNQSQGVIFLSLDKFLLGTVDNGEYEFNFIRSKGKKLIIWFTGSDIRSIVLMKARKVDAFNQDWSDIMPYVYPYVLSSDYDETKNAIALIASKYANGIFNNISDQVSYLSKVTHDTWVIVDKSVFSFNLAKFDDLSPKDLIVLHAPSNPLLKGTPLVTAAVTRLKSEGYEFNYTELGGVSREVVNSKLKAAHIVLNQFYAKIPGHFGYEAMANCCVVLQSAIIDDGAEISSPWVETNTYQIYENLKMLLDDLRKCKKIAEDGYRHALSRAHPDSLGPEINKVLREIE